MLAVGDREMVMEVEVVGEMEGLTVSVPDPHADVVLVRELEWVG